MLVFGEIIQIFGYIYINDSRQAGFSSEPIKLTFAWTNQNN